MPNLDPVILFFLLGAGAGLAKAELRLPAAIYDFVSTLLLLAIGLKGGVELARAGEGLPAVELAALLVLGFGLPVPAFLAARYLGGLSRADAASLSATAETDRLHFADMAVQVGRLQKIGMP